MMNEYCARFISFKEFILLANKYLGDLDSDGVPQWANLLFKDLYNLFGGVYNNQYTEQTTNLAAYYQDIEEMINKLFQRYGNRYIAKRYQAGEKTAYYGSAFNFTEIDALSEEQAFNMIVQYMYDKITDWIGLRGKEAIRIQSVLQLNYNPIDNYNMVENHTGEKKITKTINDDEIGFIDVNAPVTGLTVSKDADTGKFNLDSITMVSSKDLTSSGNSANLSTSLNGQVGSTVTAGANGSSWTTVNGTNPTTTEQVTTYDSDTFHNNKQTSESGDVAVGTQNANYIKSEVSANAEIRLGSPDAGYTETEDVSNLGLTRKGNIGVTTTQQMIEQELELRSRKEILKLIDELFDSFCLLTLV